MSGRQSTEKDYRCPKHPSARIGYTDPTGGDPWMGGPVNIAVCMKCGAQAVKAQVREQIDQRDDLAHRIREAWQQPGVIRYDTDDEWRMAVAAADVALPPGGES